jgi:aspartyl-tRNA(Asn)/glutamyl-tRNA(Gln) amidotransferase subunit A
MTLATLHARYGAGATAEEVVGECLAALRAHDGDIGAFLEVWEEEALAAAREADAAKARGEVLGSLWGVPVALKDNMLFAGHTATSASRVLEGYRAPYSAAFVERLLAAGAILVGRTNMDEFACGSSTETSAWQRTRNPVDTSRVPGGSSGGAAAAVAAGMVPLAIGSDTGGSVRQPAALCGIVGFKPTYGAIPRHGLMSLASSLDTVSPFARTVADVRTCAGVLAGADARDTTSVSVAMHHDPLRLAGVRVGVPKPFFEHDPLGEVNGVVREALHRMEAHGAVLVPLDMPLLPLALAMYYVLMPAELSSNLARYDGWRYGARVDGGNGLPVREAMERRRGELFGEEIQRRLLIGSFVLSAGYSDAYYHRAVEARAALRDELATAFESVDVLAGPTSPMVAWELGAKVEDPLAMYLADLYTVGANLAGTPAISLPCGFVGHLPVGLHLMGPLAGDARLLAIAEAVEQVLAV